MSTEPRDVTMRLPNGDRITGHPDAARAMIAAVDAAEERRMRWPRRDDGELDAARATTMLARGFPSLRLADGVTPWNADRFVAWLAGPAPSAGMAHAGRFVLGVWNPRADWAEVARELGIDAAEGRLGKFDLFAAMGGARCVRGSALVR